MRVLIEVFHVSRYIDQGRNPQLYTKECLERALAKNEQVKGKIDTMKVRLLEAENKVRTGILSEQIWLIDLVVLLRTC